MDKLQSFHIEGFQKDLIAWFQLEQRSLPWRENKDPYRIWVSEIMLQQTRVDTVIPYFHRFMERFPTVDALAEADEEDILKAWEGLGYYSRVRNLQTAVREVKEKYSSVVPPDPDAFAGLKGVGPYTRGAVMSIAYNIPEPAVDGNVMRVISRVLAIDEDIAKPRARKIFEEAIRKMISKDNPSDFNQALMELGALICIPSKPACLLCPVQEYCEAFHTGTQSSYPVKSKKSKPKPVRMGAAVIKDEEGRFYINKRKSEGLLANLWEFPNCEIVPGPAAKEQLEGYLQEEYGLQVDLEVCEESVTHVFSHIKWDISLFTGSVKKGQSTSLAKVTEEEMQRYAFPVSHQKISRIAAELAEDALNQ
ncbi:A/G-specific adenine glycosylase [Metabacillus sp. GX 13764]|uniref:A/G-specific adenine glycosylase n=1 Tax=Metabacillus kandeliae TaxID=2900151 RepID=UPI001E5C9D58|nr:A/G-specific adenine glycosylase [Metabacillus kandeliae]MCD7036382.1 A/G-specific adenine glycosylase [Metabacillus kandeliae]